MEAQPGEWTWMGGSTSANQPGIYGTAGVSAVGNLPGARSGAVSWSDGTGDLWLFGGAGYDAAGVSSVLNDLWKYTPSTSEWTWMGGSSAVNQLSVYGTLGVPAAGNVPGARSGAVSWSDGSGNFWLFGGTGYDAAGVSTVLNDLWCYSPSTGQWTWMGGSTSANQPGIYGTLGVAASGNVPGARSGAVSWSDGSGDLWLFGGAGYDAAGVSSALNDLWKYTPSTREWTWMGGSSAVNQLSVYGTLGVPAAGNVPGARQGSVSWTDPNGNFWLFGGAGYDAQSSGFLNDLWMYAPSTGEWTWVSGHNAGNQPSNYGTLGVPAASNVPGARNVAAGWTDDNGNLWLFGGEGYDTQNFGELNDLWMYAPSTGEWTWMSGYNVGNQPSVYGRLGLPAADNVLGARNPGASWRDASGTFWLLGGLGFWASNAEGDLNDLWNYNPPTLPSLTTPAPGSKLAKSKVTTFAWNPGVGAVLFELKLGTQGAGSSDVYSGAATTATSVQVAGLPTSKKQPTLYARLYYNLNGTWSWLDYTYLNAGH
jgi:N-acetylneuraminic acid mutarotase